MISLELSPELAVTERSSCGHFWSLAITFGFKKDF